MLEHELGSSAENNRPFLEKLDEALTRLEARLQPRATAQESAADIRNAGSRPRPDPARRWSGCASTAKSTAANGLLLMGGRLIAHGPDAMGVYAAAEADGAYLPMIKYMSL